MAKTEFLQIRVSPEDLSKIRQAAEEDHLDTSTWARRVILQAIDKKKSKEEISSSSDGL